MKLEFFPAAEQELLEAAKEYEAHQNMRRTFPDSALISSRFERTPIADVHLLGLSNGAAQLRR